METLFESLIKAIDSVKGPFTLIAFLAVIALGFFYFEVKNGTLIKSLPHLFEDRLSRKDFYGLSRLSISGCLVIVLVLGVVSLLLAFNVITAGDLIAGQSESTPVPATAIAAAEPEPSRPPPQEPPNGGESKPPEEPDGEGGEGEPEEPVAEALCPLVPSGEGEALPGPLPPISMANLDSLQVVANWPYASQIDNTEIAFSRDGLILISALGDGSIELWSVVDGRRLDRYPIHQAQIRDIAVAAAESDLQLFATASSDSTARIWILDDQIARAFEQVMKRDDRGMNAVAFSPDGEFIVTGDQTNRVSLWNVASRSFLDDETWLDTETQQEGQFEVTAVRFSPDGRRVAATSSDGSIQFWNVSRGETPLSSPFLRRDFEIDPRSPFDLSGMSFSPSDANVVATSYALGPIRFWNVQGREVLAEIHPADPVEQVEYSIDGRFLAGVTEAGIVYFWGLDGSELRILDVLDRGRGMAFSPDETYLALGAETGIVLYGVNPCSR